MVEELRRQARPREGGRGRHQHMGGGKGQGRKDRTVIARFRREVIYALPGMRQAPGPREVQTVAHPALSSVLSTVRR